jgi:hypothetical protein
MLLFVSFIVVLSCILLPKNVDAEGKKQVIRGKFRMEKINFLWDKATHVLTKPADVKRIEKLEV